MPVMWILITFGIVIVLAVLAGVFVGKGAKDGAAGLGTSWVLSIILVNLWFWAWVIYAAVHFINKAW